MWRGVFLLGLRGSGKSTLARALAAELHLTSLDTDELLAADCGREPGDLLRDQGETEFRRQEAASILGRSAELRRGGRVVALGGGSAESPGVEALLQDLRRRHGYAGVWLIADPRLLASRLRRDPGDRPRLAGRSVEEEIRLLTARRAALFARLADLRFDDSRQDPAARARTLAARLAELRPPGA
jgi:shikimate kinase